MLLLSTFNLGLLPNYDVALELVHLHDAREAAELLPKNAPWTSYVWHVQTARLFTRLLEQDVDFRPLPLQLRVGDIALIGTHDPTNAADQVDWCRVQVHPPLPPVPAPARASLVADVTLLRLPKCDVALNVIHPPKSPRAHFGADVPLIPLVQGARLAIDDVAVAVADRVGENSEVVVVEVRELAALDGGRNA